MTVNRVFIILAIIALFCGFLVAAGVALPLPALAWAFLAGVFWLIAHV